MAVDMYKSALGSWTEAKAGDTKHSPTHKLLSTQEYETLLDKIRQAQKEKTDAIQQGISDVETYKKQAQRDLEEAKEQLAAAQVEVEQQRSLNANLLRIARERANAQRGLTPKKEHMGYRFSGKISQTKVKAGYSKKTGVLYAASWVATLETPYNGTIPLSSIKNVITEDLTENGVLSSIGVQWWYNPESGGLWAGDYSDALANDSENSRLFDYKFSINPRTGFWEIELHTTKEIRPTASMMGQYKI